MVREQRAAALMRLGDGVRRSLRERMHVHVVRVAEVKSSQQILDVFRGGRFVERDGEGIIASVAEIDVRRVRGGEDDVVVRLRDGDVNGVEKRLARDGEFAPKLRDSGSERARGEMHAAGDFPQPVRAVIHGIHRGHHGEEHLRGADVRRGLVAADVLLARLEREAECGVPVRVLRHADETARHHAFEFILRREVARVRPAESHRHAETLRASDHDVRAEFRGRAQKHERERVRGADAERAHRVGLFEKRGVVADAAERVGILHDHGAIMLRRDELTFVADRHLHAEWLGAGLHDGDRLRVAALRDENGFHDVVLFQRERHVHRLGGGGGLVEQRAI